MKTQSLLSGIALALLLGTAPAGAISLKIGGDGGLVSTGDSGSGDAGISVGVGSDDGGLEVDANVNTKLKLLEGDSDGDGVVDIFGKKPVLATGGDGLVTVDTNDNKNALVTLFGNPKGGAVLDDVGVEAEVLEADRDEEVLVRLFGTGSADSTASVDLGGDGDPTKVEILGTDGTLGDSADVAVFGDGSNSAELTLFGSGDSGTDDDRTRMMSEPLMASSRSTGGEGDSGIDETKTASTENRGGAGGAGAMQRPAGAAPVPQTRLAATGRASTSNCFSPTQAQIDYLLGRSSYGPEDAEKWQQVARVNVVPVDICPSAAVQLQAAIAADNDIGYMQAAIADNEVLSAELSPYGPENVLAVEQANEEATVYVY